MEAAALDEVTAVLLQVEFYFSDGNLPRDKFLRKNVEESDDSLVSLALTCSFTWMRSHLGLASSKADEIPEETVKAVADVLKNSSTLKISDFRTKVGRITELAKVEEVIEQVDMRTIAVAPLEHDVKWEDVESFFGQFSKVNSVILPCHVADKKLFCGTSLVEFASQVDVEIIMNKSLVYFGAELGLKPKYQNGLLMSFKLTRVKIEGSAEKNGVCKHAAEGNAPNDQVNVSKPDGGIEASNDVIEKADNEGSASIENGDQDEELKVKETNGLASGEKDDDQSLDDASEKEIDNEEYSLTASRDSTDVVRREDLKTILNKFGTVKYVDFVMGAESRYIRFEEPEEAQKARAAAVLAEEGGLLVKNFIATLESLTGVVEKEYWKALGENQGKFRDPDNRDGGGRKMFTGASTLPQRIKTRAGGRPNKVRKPFGMMPGPLF